MLLARRHFLLPESFPLTVSLSLPPPPLMPLSLFKRVWFEMRPFIFNSTALFVQATFLGKPLSLTNSLAASRLPQRSVVRFTTSSSPLLRPLR